MGAFYNTISHFQCHSYPLNDNDENSFKEFDQPDDARSATESNQNRPIKITSPYGDNIDAPSKDLLNRLLEKEPKYRLKSVLNLRRIAFYHNFNFDDVRHRKVS